MDENQREKPEGREKSNTFHIWGNNADRNFSSENYGDQKIFKVLKKKKNQNNNCKLQILYLAKISFQNEDKADTFIFQRGREVFCQKTCKTGNAKGNFSG